MKYIYRLTKAVALLYLLFVATPAWSQPGAFDPTFGVGGKVAVSYPGFSVQHQDIKVLPDQKIVELSLLHKFRPAGSPYVHDYYYLLSRKLPNGQPDSSFGTNGMVVDSLIRAYAIALQPDGKILLTGATQDSLNFILLRYNANGSTDNSFGVNGRVKTNFLNGTWTYPADVSTAVFVLPNGKILQGGHSFYGSSFFSNIRFLANGTVDSTYGVNGKSYVLSPMGIPLDINANGPDWSRTPLQTVLDSSQRLVVASQDGVVRLTQNGDIDSSFGINGLAASLGCYNWGSGLVEPDGKMVFASCYSYGSIQNLVVLHRLFADGTIDTSFKTIPIVKPPFIPEVLISKIIRLPNGQYLFSFKTLYGQVPANTTWGIARINSNGTLDSAFGINGVRHTDYPLFYGNALQKDGKLLAGGSGTFYPPYDSAVIARLENILPNNNFLQLSVYLDRNSNGIKDLGEPLFPYASASASKAGGAGSVTANSSSGHFEIAVDTGSYTTTVTPLQPYYNIVPSSYTTSHASYFNTDVFSIGLQPIPGNEDLTITIIPLSLLRLDSKASYKILCRNSGTEPVAGGSFKLIKDSRFTFEYANTNPASMSGDTLTWNFTSLAAFDTVGAVVTFKTSFSPALNLGDTVVFRASVSTVPGEVNTSDNQVTLHDVVVGSYDPNDKTENHSGRITHAKAIGGEYLTYTIRFQNTGNDTSFNVYIRDTLDSKLDWNTLHIGASSHNCRMTMNDGKCLFTFPFIKLVDSLHNNPLSHGYIIYKIKAKPNVQIGDVIKNTAAIYFDYNLPVRTNTENTTVIADVLPLKLLTFTAKKEGKVNRLQWSTSNEVNVDRFEVQRSKDGSEFSKIGSVKSKSESGLSSYEFTDEKPETRNANYYRLKMVDKDGSFIYSKTVQLSIVNYPLSIAIHPNPVKDVLEVQIDNVGSRGDNVGSRRGVNLQVQVTGQDGKVVLSTIWSVSEGTTMQTLNVSALQSGSYFLRVTSLNPPPGGRGAELVKFEKL